MAPSSSQRVVTAVSLFAVTAFLVWRYQKLQKSDCDGVEESSQPLSNEFVQWSQNVTTDLLLQSSLSDGERLILYSLYKQATVGDAPAFPRLSGSKLNWMDETAKHQAWKGMHGMSSVEAQRRYIHAVQDIQTRVASGMEDTYDEAMGLTPTVSRPIMEEEQDDAVANTPEAKLLQAARANQVDQLQALVEANVDINYRDDSGQTALHLAADSNHVEAVQFLVERGAHVHASDLDGISVLQAAVIAGHVPICVYLLRNGANPDQPDADG